MSSYRCSIREKFTGKEFDEDGAYEAGSTKIGGIRLNYFGAREYDPVVGMWTSVDPKTDNRPWQHPHDVRQEIF